MKTQKMGLGLGVAIVLSVFAAAAGAHTVNIAGGLNLRTGPGFGYSVIRVLANGTQVNTVSTYGSWTKINSPATGWVWSAYLSNTPHTAASSSSGPDFTWPVSGRITTTWYEVRSYGYHAAIDIGAGYWTPVAPARSGSVTFRGWSGGYGNLVIIGHEAGYSTYYGHNIAFGSSGWVSRGSTSSYIGSTGNSTGPHCHFEIRRWGSKQYIPGYQGQYLNKGWGVPYNYSGI